MTHAPEVETFTYAAPEDSRARRALIRAIETMTGQPELKRYYQRFQAETRSGERTEDFFSSAVRQLRLELLYDAGRLAATPREGPLVVIANHPFGVLDGIVICHLMMKVRRDFRILTNSALYRVPEIHEWLLPVDFTETPQALETNLRTRAEARRFLEAGGALIVFPGGGVATTPRLLSRRAEELEWKPLTARLIQQAKASVLPIYFHGQNSRLFQIASHMSMTLRLALIFREVHRRIGTRTPITIGAPIPYERLKGISDRKDMMTFLKQSVDALAGRDAP